MTAAHLPITLYPSRIKLMLLLDEQRQRACGQGWRAPA